tara:strand:- start:13 stop:465 length:453 start_codon:yes stop_codon:yes gene_type:complete
MYGVNSMFEYVILASVVAGGICAIVISKNLYGNNVIHGKIKNRYDSYIIELEKENKQMKGKLNKMKNGLSINKEDFDPENPLSSIGGLISQIAPMLPKNIQPLLQSPEAMGFIEKMVKENPEKVTDLISKFVKTPKGKSNDASVENTESV